MTARFTATHHATAAGLNSSLGSSSFLQFRHQPGFVHAVRADTISATMRALNASLFNEGDECPKWFRESDPPGSRPPSSPGCEAGFSRIVLARQRSQY